MVAVEVVLLAVVVVVPTGGKIMFTMTILLVSYMRKNLLNNSLKRTMSFVQTYNKFEASYDINKTK